LIERYFVQPAVLNRTRNGILSPYLDALWPPSSKRSIIPEKASAVSFGTPMPLAVGSRIPPHLQYAAPRVRQRAHAALPRFLTTLGHTGWS